jgi:hypothetical protein
MQLALPPHQQLYHQYLLPTPQLLAHQPRRHHPFGQPLLIQFLLLLPQAGIPLKALKLTLAFLRLAFYAH